MQDSFAEFLARLQARDDTAAQELFARFAGQLIALARRRFASGLEHKIDPESAVQSAFKSFFHRFDGGKFELDGGWAVNDLPSPAIHFRHRERFVPRPLPGNSALAP